MTRLTKLLIISSIAALTGCSVLAEREMAHEPKNTTKEKSMSTSNPVDIVNQLVKAVNQGNLEAAVACYEPEATLIVQPGQVATGTKALREAFAGFIAIPCAVIN